MCWVNTNATKLCHRLASAETCRADPANGTTPKHAGTDTLSTHSSRHSLGKPSVLVSCRSPDLPSCFRLGWRCAGPGRPVAPCPNFRLPDRLRPLQDIHNVSSHVSKANRFPPSSGQTGRVFFLRSLPGGTIKHEFSALAPGGTRRKGRCADTAVSGQHGHAGANSGRGDAEVL